MPYVIRLQYRLGVKQHFIFPPENVVQVLPADTERCLGETLRSLSTMML